MSQQANDTIVASDAVGAAQVGALLEQAVLARAATLARAGQYGSATQLLAGFDSAAVLDLRARICAQQGRLLDAERLWNQAAEREPGNPAHAAALRRIALLQRRPPLLGVLFSPPIGLAIGMIAVFTFGWWWRGAAEAPIASNAGRDAMPTDTAPAVVSRAPDITISAMGVHATTQGPALMLRFDAPLFDDGTRLRPEAGPTLDALALQLQPEQQRVVIHVIGHTDDRPVRAGARFPDNTSLGLARAVVVAERLRAAGIHAGTVFVATAGEADPPYANDTVENRRRNRTVTIRVYERSPEKAGQP